MNKKLKIAIIKDIPTPEARELYQKHCKEGIPYIELRQGKRYGEIWFETPFGIPFDPKTAFALREWHEAYWLKRKTYKGLHPYRFSLGPTAIWFKFVLKDLDMVEKQLSRLVWGKPHSQKSLSTYNTRSEKIFWSYTEHYFKKSNSMSRKGGENVDMSDWKPPEQK